MAIPAEATADLGEVLADPARSFFDKVDALNQVAQRRCVTFGDDFVGQECPSSSLGLGTPTDEEYSAARARVKALLAELKCTNS